MPNSYYTVPSSIWTTQQRTYGSFIDDISFQNEEEIKRDKAKHELIDCVARLRKLIEDKYEYTHKKSEQFILADMFRLMDVISPKEIKDDNEI